MRKDITQDQGKRGGGERDRKGELGKAVNETKVHGDATNGLQVHFRGGAGREGGVGGVFSWFFKF